MFKSGLDLDFSSEVGHTNRARADAKHSCNYERPYIDDLHVAPLDATGVATPDLFECGSVKLNFCISRQILLYYQEAGWQNCFENARIFCLHRSRNQWISAEKL